MEQRLRELIAEYERLILEQGAKSWEDYRCWWNVRHELRRLLDEAEKSRIARLLDEEKEGW